eukprot:5602564-Pyramimonas_sp.AAC.1
MTATWASLFPRSTNERLSRFPRDDRPRLKANCDFPPLPPRKSSASTLLRRPLHKAVLMENTSACASAGNPAGSVMK